ncbi:restriction endonuclease subunit S [Brucella anthropi]|uniref:restriction endonuclease subunit S n=1 Tax=Brucella anthropi TaxID=529 RepID=UPI00178C3C9F|nr:restriction endonuclease subunit S [Brucella anthropi]
MTDFQPRSLGDVVELKRGYDLPARLRSDGPYALVSSSGPSDRHAKAKVRGPGVVTGRYGTIGQVFFVEGDFWPLNTTLYVRDFKGNDPRFIYYFLQTLDWHKFNDKSGVPGVNRNDAHREPVLIPNPVDQRAIAKMLGSLDDKIELNRQMNETLEAMAQSIFRDWFVDFGPTRRKLEGAVDPITIMGGLVQDIERAQALADLFPAALGDDGPPEGWSFGIASSLIEFNPKEPLKKGTPAPYSDMSSLPTSGSLADLPVERGYGSGMRFRNGDALLARITPCLENGKSAFVDFLPDAQTVGWGSTEFYVLRSRKGVPAPFAYLLVRHPDFRAAAIASMTGTSGRQRAQVDRLKDFPFAGAPMELLGEFGKFILPMFDKITANGGESRTLAATRDLLLPKLMSGEICLSEAESVMEAAQ